MPIMSELLHVVVRGFETKTSRSQKHLPPLTAMASVLTIRPWLIHYQLKGIKRREQRTATTASQLGREVSQLDCLHLTLAYRYHLFVWRRCESMSLSYSQQQCGQLWANSTASNVIVRDFETMTPTLHWRHNDHDGVSNHQPHGCLLNRIFRPRSKKTSKLRVPGFCVGSSPGPVNSPHKGSVMRKMFPFDDVIMDLRDNFHHKQRWPTS